MRTAVADDDNSCLDRHADQLRNKLRLVMGNPADEEPEITPESCGIDPETEWRSGLICRAAKRGGVMSYLCRVHNLILILENDPAWAGRLQFDEFRQQITDRGDEFQDAQEIELKAWLEKHWISNEVKTSVVREAVCAVAARHPVHPVREWLQGMTWDGTERLPTFFKDFCGTPFTPYSESVGRALFVSAVARIMRPGCKVDTMVVLEGPQGLGKSRMVQTLFGSTWHCDITEAPGALDFYQNLAGKWVGEFSELSSFGKADQSRIKQAISGTHDTYRASYGRNSRTRPRQFVFIGNTNKPEYLQDETGARRYLPIECTEIDIDAVTPLVPQLWAEAVHRFNAGEKWWDIPDAAHEQESRYQQDVWEEKIAGWISEKKSVTLLEILEGCLWLKPERQGRQEQTRVGMILTRLRWKKQRESTGDRKRYYIPPSPSKKQ